MAVTVREYSISAFWNSNTVLDMLQTACKDVGFFSGHANQTGTILTFTNTAGTTVAAARGNRYLVKQASSNGAGNFATFDITRNATTGALGTVTLVRGGRNYSAGNTLTIPGAFIGGSNTTDNVTITASTVSGAQGNANVWYDQDTSSPYTWGVMCIDVDEAKRLGQTVYTFHIPANPTINPVLYMRSGPGFQTGTNVLNGVSSLDFFSTNSITSTTQQQFSIIIARSNACPLKLITYQSGIDPKFVVFQFAEVGTNGDVYRNPFILSNYNTAYQPWSLDDVFLGGIWEVQRNQVFNTSETAIDFRCLSATMGKRQAEWGWGNAQGTAAQAALLIGYYESIYASKTGQTRKNQQFPCIYQRTVHDLAQKDLVYNPVITGIPICNALVPVPYFIPADFGITEVVGTNTIAYNELISVGATTKWRVIQFAQNMGVVTYLTSMAFVAKTVD